MKLDLEEFPLKKLSTAASRFCYNHPNFGIPNLMLYIVIGNVIVYVLDMLSSYTFSPMLTFVPAYLARGQVWRLVTFLFVPDNSNILFLAISLYFYYWIGSSLERTWGTARFTLFYLTGLVSAILVGLISCFVYGFGYTGSVTTTYYINLSLFLSFATLYPDAQVMLMFIIPVKIKWLAYLDGVMLLVGVIQYIAAGMYVMALLPVLALANYFIYFGDDLMDALRGTASRTAYRSSHRSPGTRNRRQSRTNTINMKKAARDMQQSKGYLHKCCVCGKTDTDYPDMEFRYCSKCAGYRCYCMEHINNHVHITEE